MSTRSITEFVDAQGEVVAQIYRHFDGYPAGHGADLARWLEGLRVLNGKGAGWDPRTMVNGFGRLVARVVASMWQEGHEPNLLVVVEPHDYGDAAYVYRVTEHSRGITVEAFETAYESFTSPTTTGKRLFRGTPQAFARWIERNKP